MTFAAKETAANQVQRSLQAAFPLVKKKARRVGLTLNLRDWGQTGYRCNGCDATQWLATFTLLANF